MADEARTLKRFRRPWYWMTVLLMATVASTLLIAQNARTRVMQNDRQFATAQELRFSSLKRSIDGLFGDAVQVDSSGAEIYSKIPAQRSLLSRIGRELYASILNPHIYGAGAFFVRGGFARGQLDSVYVRRPDDTVPRSLNDHAFSRAVEVDYAQRRIPRQDDYTRDEWFKAAIRNRGRTVVHGPYIDQGRSFVSVLRAFDRRGHLAGVMAVDILSSDLIAVMRRSLGPNDVAAIYGPAPSYPRVLGTGANPGSAHRDVLRGVLVYTPRSHIELSSDASELFAANQRIRLETTLLLGALWLVCIIIAMGVLQRWAATEREGDLEVEQMRLERQIAISRTVEAELRKAAYTDALTGLPNRAAFLERTREILGAASGSFAVFFIDLDRFNRVNETLGHLAGDELLRTVGNRLVSLLDEGDMVARLGGDEFVALVDLRDRPPVDEIAMNVLQHMSEPVLVHGRPLYPQGSIGIVVPEGSYSGPEELLRDADIAMYEAKRQGRARCVVFDAQMRRRVADDAELEAALRRALERGDLLPHYQPVVDVKGGNVVGFEALVRWQRPGGLVSAGEFMPFAETHGLTAVIDERMMSEVFSHSRAIFDCFPGTKIAVNISAAQLGAAGLAETIEALQARDARPGDRFELEITETTMMSDSESSIRMMERLRGLGIEFMLDDFGTGYSSLAYLQRLPITGLKIDRGFVDPLPADAKAVEIVRSIVLLAHSMGLVVTAEGVETMEQFDLLRRLDVDCAQGFFFSPAIDMASVLLLQERSISSRSAVE